MEHQTTISLALRNTQMLGNSCFTGNQRVSSYETGLHHVLLYAVLYSEMLYSTHEWDCLLPEASILRILHKAEQVSIIGKRHIENWTTCRLRKFTEAKTIPIDWTSSQKIISNLALQLAKNILFLQISDFNTWNFFRQRVWTFELYKITRATPGTSANFLLKHF